MPRTRTTKKLAQRIDLNYFKRPRVLGRWQTRLSLALLAAAIVWLAWYGIRRDRRVYSAGPLSAAHAVLSKQCAACHVTQMGFFSEKVTDQKCVACHDGAVHHAEQAFTPSCASCHVDHRGPVRLAATADAACTQCHANLARRDGPTEFARNITSFTGNHSEFAILRAGKGDPGAIELNHYLHLQPNLTGPAGRVQMVCTDCHRSAADAKLPWPYGETPSGSAVAAASTPVPGQGGAPSTVAAGTVPAAPSRAFMAPPTYAQTCAACHLLQFDKRFTEQVPHDTPEVIRPFLTARFAAYIVAHPAELRVPRDPGRDLPQRPVPADYRVLTPAQWIAERTAEAEQLLWRKTCQQCHTLTTEQGAEMPKVAPSNITARYMPHARFDHSKHGLVDCASCHTGAAKSQQTSDLLLPGIATCQSCHRPATEAAESRCFQCHTYHDPAERKPAHSNFSLTDVLQ